ncbi:MAG: hypothetical protein ACI4WW_00765 [Candidatus Coprovivens sp.]
MQEVPLIIKIWNMIKIFFKMLILYIIKFILIIFGLEDKEEKVNKEIIVVTEELKSGKKTIREPNFSVPVDPSSLTTDPGNHPDELKKKKETVVYKHISNQYNGNIRIFSVTSEMIDRIIDSYIEEKEEVKVDKFDKDLKEDYKDWKKEIIVPLVKIEFEKKYIKDEDTLKTSLTKILEIELEEQHKKLDKEKEKKQDNKPLTIKSKKNKETIIVDFKRELHPEKKEEVKEVKEEVSLSSITSTPSNSIEEIVEQPKEKDEITLSDEVNQIIMASALVMNNIEKVLVEKKIEQQKKEKSKNKDNAKKEVQEPVVVASKDDLQLEKEKIKVEVPTPPIQGQEEVKEGIKVTVEKEEQIKSVEALKEQEEIVQVQVIEKEVNGQVVQEEQIVIKPIDLPNVDISEDSIERKVRDESYKEDIEDRDYDSLEHKVDEALEKIEMFIIANESKLSKQQLEQLQIEKEKLLITKEKINKQRELDIEVERKDLENDIKRSELDGLQDELRRMHIEDQLQMSQLMINKLDDLNYMTESNAREIEKKLLKLKLKEACRALSYPSLFALPFVRNKYFFFFTVGLFVNRRLGFIGNIFRRHTPDYQEEELNNLVTGKDALNGALNTMRENIDYLNVLEEQAMQRYPELARDHEYLAYLNSLKHRLNANYNRLTRRQNTIDRLIYRTKKNIKVLKRKKNKYYNNAA